MNFPRNLISSVLKDSVKINPMSFDCWTQLFNSYLLCSLLFDDLGGISIVHTGHVIEVDELLLNLWVCMTQPTGSSICLLSLFLGCGVYVRFWCVWLPLLFPCPCVIYSQYISASLPPVSPEHIKSGIIYLTSVWWRLWTGSHQFTENYRNGSPRK